MISFTSPARQPARPKSLPPVRLFDDDEKQRRIETRMLKNVGARRRKEMDMLYDMIQII